MPGPDSPPREKALYVHDRLCDVYGAPFDFFHDHDPLSELVSALLSHRTRNADSGHAFRELKKRFDGWDAVRRAPVGAIEAAIQPCTWPEQKAPRVKAALHHIHEHRGGTLSLDFLADWSVPDARAWLEAINGVGPKTSAAVLLFSRLRMPALPVDSHHHRVAQRLGLIDDSTGPGPAHDELAALLPAEWDAQAVYDHHEALMIHGQRRCTYRRPRCSGCEVLHVCPQGQRRMQRASQDDD